MSYGQWLLDRLPDLAVRAAIPAAAAAVVVLLARWLGAPLRLVGAPAFVVIASAVIVLQASLTPRVESLDRPRLVAQLRFLGDRVGLHDVEVEVRTRARVPVS